MALTRIGTRGRVLCPGRMCSHLRLTMLPAFAITAPVCTATVSSTLPVYAVSRYWGVLVLSGCLLNSELGTRKMNRNRNESMKAKDGWRPPYGPPGLVVLDPVISSLIIMASLATQTEACTHPRFCQFVRCHMQAAWTRGKPRRVCHPLPT